VEAYKVEMLRISYCLNKRLIDGGKVVSLTHPPQFTFQKHYYFYVSGNHSPNYILTVLGAVHGTWNVRRLYRAGSLVTVPKELTTFGVHSVGVLAGSCVAA
jgi:hypothetical protein